MKSLSTAVQNLIADKLGLEPVNIIEVQWVEDGNWHLYADKDITNNDVPVNGVILSLDTLESVLKLDSQGQTQSIAVTLSDVDSHFKGIIDTHDIHGRTVRVSQWFQGLPLSERFMLYEGEITSPITWKEGDRSITFDVVSKLADKEAGFSPEEGNFAYIPDSLIGVAWPLCFGTVQNVPAVRLQEVPQGTLAEDLGIADPTLWERLLELAQERTRFQSMLTYYSYAALQAAYTCTYGDTPEQREQGCSAQETLEDTISQIVSNILNINKETSDLAQTLLEQQAQEKDSVSIINGSTFPTSSISVKLGDIKLSGTFTGNTLSINSSLITTYTGYNGEPFGFTYIPAGTIVKIDTDEPIIYIASLLEATVHAVSAYRQVENGQLLTIVPTSYYSVDTADVGPYTVTYIKFDRPLSSLDETFSDDIYVTLTSTIGPNTVDIIQWLIEKYTDMDIDSTSFAYVKAKIDNYPSHFALLSRKNVYALIEEIAFQARCAVWISQNTVYIKYLAEEATEVDTITEDDIDAGSLEIFTTTTEELVTKLVATWTDNYVNTEKNKIVLRHNIKKYGTLEREIDFYIYNIGELVLKSATFWLIRLSNIWKNIKFNTYLHKLALETFDTIKFDFAQNFVADTDVKGTITSLVYDSDNSIINIEAWLPVKFGTMDVYSFALPSQISTDLKFPTNTEIAQEYAGGAGPGAAVEALLELQEQGDQIGFISISDRRERGMRDQRRDYGDEVPSDIDDTKPDVDFITTTYSPGAEPSWDYDYPDYTIVEPDIPEVITGSNVFPGKVKTKVSEPGQIYYVDVYFNGLNENPLEKEVKQLQILPEDTIPENTWVIVLRNNIGKNSNNETIYEYTMQVPVWL